MMATPAAAAPAAAKLALFAHRITVRFGGLVAVDDVTFEIPEKGIVSLIGPNGAGKTTFFNVLTGLYQPALGSVELGDRDITALPPHKIASLGLGRTFQNIRLFGTMTARENVMVAMHSPHEGRDRRDGPALPPAAPGGAGGAGVRARSCSTSSASADAPTSTRATSPTATSAGWRSPARWRCGPGCCCSTSPPPA